MVGVPTLACAVVLIQVHRIRLDADRLLEETRESGLANELLVRIEALQDLDRAPPEDADAVARGRIAAVRALIDALEEPPDEDPSRLEHQGTETGLLQVVEQGLAAVEARLGSTLATRPDAHRLLERSARAASVLAEETQRESRLLDSDIDRRGRATRRYVVGSLVTVTLAAGAGLLLVFRTILAPIKLLRTGAQRLRSGDLTHRIPVRGADEIAELGRTFNEMADELDRSHADLEAKVEARTRELVHAARLADVGVLAAGVAHEVNNPLASIASCGEALVRRLEAGELREAEARDYLQTIVSEAYRTRDITGRLLNLARTGTDRTSGDGVVKTEEVFSQAAQLTKHLLADKRLRLAVAVPDEVAAVRGDAGELLHVVLNLILNARDASPAEATIELTCSQEDGRQTWLVADRGPGIPEELADRVFDPFFTTKDPGAGTGLGLSLAAAIVDRHGGTIRVESRPGGGTRFVVQLPVDGGPLR